MSKQPTPQTFFSPQEQQWLALEAEQEPDSPGNSETSADERRKNIEKNKNTLREMLLMALSMPNLIVLAGSGTSLGEVGAPSMWNLWDYCVNQNAGELDKTATTKTKTAEAVIQKIEFNGKDNNALIRHCQEWLKNHSDDPNRQKVERFINPQVPASSESEKEGSETDNTSIRNEIISITGFNQNIEALLSHCEAWLQIHPDDQEVNDFVTQSKQTILAKCTEFLSDDKLETHRTFVRKLSGRHNRNPRLKIFTTNYDLCFERAAALQGLIVIDGFSFSQPRRFDPLNFTYDIVRRPRSIEEHAAYLDGVFHLLKLHGSVNWERDGNTVIENAKPDAEKACLIYPARGKYQQSYVQPHLELVSQFFASLREPNTCVIVAGFGFNDDHLSEPMLAAIKSNPNLKFIVVDPDAKDLAEGTKPNASSYWKALYKLAQNDADVWLLNADFSQFVSRIPDLKALSRAQKLEQAVINTVKGSL